MQTMKDPVTRFCESISVENFSFSERTDHPQLSQRAKYATDAEKTSGTTGVKMSQKGILVELPS